MFWYLTLAHLLADYPLQPSWMVNQKSRSRVLLAHAIMHFGLQVVIIGVAALSIWPYLLLLSTIHLAVDWSKTRLSELRPKWVILPYIIDQIIHYTTIALVAFWIERLRGQVNLPLPRTWMIYAIVYLLVTYVWFISERIINYANTDYRKEMAEQFWSRMFARALFMSGILFFWKWISESVLLSTLAFPMPYMTGKNGLRALVTDISVAFAGAMLLLWVGA